MKKYYLLTLLFIFLGVKVNIHFFEVYNFKKKSPFYKNISGDGPNIQNQIDENRTHSTEESSKNVCNSDEIKEIGCLLSLDTLFSSVGCLNPEFHCDSLYYHLNVDLHIDKLFLFAKISQDDIPVKIGLHNLGTGNSKYAIIVTPENELASKTYIININRESHIPNTGIPL